MLWRFIVATLTTFKSNIALPGVFQDNPFQFPMGTVWTLKYEVLCYVGVLVVGLVGLLRSRLAAIVLVAGLARGTRWCSISFYPAASKGIETSIRLPLIFAVGGALYVWRDKVRISGLVVLALLAATWLSTGTFLFKTLLFAGTAYGMLWLALSPALTRWSDDPKPTCPTAPISMAGRSSRRCTRSFRAAAPLCCSRRRWCSRSRSRPFPGWVSRSRRWR